MPKRDTRLTNAKAPRTVKGRRASQTMPKVSANEAGRARVKSTRIRDRSTAPVVKSTSIPRMPRTKLTEGDLETFRRLLLQKREELLGDVRNMEAEALRQNRTSAAGDLSMMPIHMADIGTDAYEQEFTIGLIENGNEILKEIDAASERIQDGTFGICEATGKPISKARLKAKPWARYCLAYKRLQEKNGRP